MHEGYTGPSVILSAVIVRACADCGGKREIGQPCAGCGTDRLPQVTDLGVIASRQRGWLDQLKWTMWGYRAAQWRIQRENRRLSRQNTERVLVSLIT